MGKQAFASYVAQPLLGVNDFLNIPLGTVVSFSYDFTILQAGQTGSNVQTETITIPASTQTMGFGRINQMRTIQIPKETMTIPVNIPQGLAPLMLPSDFNQTINNQFCFILQNNSGNYSLNVSALNDYEMSNITQSVGYNTGFMNASEDIKENAWYNITATISDNGIAANLYNTNGTLIESTVSPYNATNSNEMVMLITNNVDNAVIFKNLTVNTFSNLVQPQTSKGKTINKNGSLFPYVGLTILLVATFLVVLVYAKKKRQMNQKTSENVKPNEPNKTENQVNSQDSIV